MTYRITGKGRVVLNPCSACGGSRGEVNKAHARHWWKFGTPANGATALCSKCKRSKAVPA